MMNPGFGDSIQQPQTLAKGAAAYVPPVVRSSAIQRLYQVFLVFLIYGALEGLLKRLTGYAWYIYPIKDVLFLVVLAHWAPLARTRLGPVRLPYSSLLLVYLAFVAVQALNPHLPTPLLWLAGFRTSYMYALLYFVAHQAFGATERMEVLAKVVGALAVITAVGAMVESYLGLDWVYAHKLQVFINAAYVGASGDWVIRPSSIGNGPGSAAMMEYIGAIALLGLGIGNPRRAHRIAYFCAAGLALGGVLLGATRIIWLQAAMALVIFAVTAGPRGLRRATSILALTGVAVLVSLIFSKGEITGRFQMLQTPLDSYRTERYGALRLLPHALADFPLGAGVGWNVPRRDLFAPSYTEESTQYAGVHNYLSSLAVELGLPGLILFLGFSIAVATRGLRSVMRVANVRDRALFAACCAIFVSMLVSFLAGGALAGWPGEYYWIFAAIIVCADRFESGRRVEGPPHHGHESHHSP